MLTLGQVHVGTVKSWNPQKGWGHIECGATKNMYGKDIFMMRSAIPGGHCAIGDRVSFSVVDGQKGPEACNVTIVAAKAAATGEFPAHALFGSVKSYEAEKGWGHISCDQTREWYGKDMFFLKSSLMGQLVEAGDKVRFHLGMGSKGVEAQNIAVVGKPESKGYGGYFMPDPTQPMKKPKLAAPAQATSAQRFSGTVKNWNIEKGWGFILCMETMTVYGKDIFLHRNELNGQAPSTGAPLEFSVDLGQDGRLVATNVKFPKQQQKAPQRLAPPQAFAQAQVYQQRPHIAAQQRNNTANFWSPY
jgi:CspA family cold shock protein